MSITNTTVSLGVTQPDGRAWITEVHTTSDGKTVSGSYKGNPVGALERAQAKVAAIETMLAQAEAEAIINGR